MGTESVYTIVDHIDRQLNKLKLVKTNKPAFVHLMDLRNNMLLVYRPNPQLDWTFKNKKLLSFFSFEVKWVEP